MTTPFGSSSSEAPSPDVTELLRGWSSGDRLAGEQLIAAVYTELHRQAGRAMRREADDHTLQTTALVHEAYIRLIDQRRVEWRNRAHFFGVAAQLMRRILVDHARRRHAGKRGRGQRHVSLDDVDVAPEASTAPGGLDVLALDELLDRLTAMDESQARIVELRYFGGLSIEETAEVMQVSPATIKREWAIARAGVRPALAA